MEKILDKVMDKAQGIIDENEKLIANILHDIKSPLYSIKIGLQSHLETELIKDVFTTTIDTIEYIENFLVNYNFKQGKFESRITPCDIKKIIDKKIENYKYIFIEKNIHIDMFLEENDNNYIINSIEIFLSSIIGNIISNIAFHASKSKSAFIEIFRKNNKIIVNFKNYYESTQSDFSLGLDFCKKLSQLIKADLKFSKTKTQVEVELKIPSLSLN